MFSVPVLFGLSFITDQVFNVNMHDTYFTMGSRPLLRAMALVTGLYALFYWCIPQTTKVFSDWLTAVHLGSCFPGPLLLFLVSLFYADELISGHNDTLDIVTAFIVVIMLVGQIAFPSNIVYALIRKEKDTKSE